jgi:hypothetical protein
MVIETRITWDRNLCLPFIQEVLRELLFCRDNVRNINFSLLTNYSQKVSLCNCSFILPDLKILTQFWLSVYHLMFLYLWTSLKVIKACSTDEFFSFIDDLWGAHSIDRFASIVNRKTERFNSLFWNPGSETVDAFTQNCHF